MSAWTPERDQALRDLADAGLTSGEIARNIGMSRNAVMGKLWRLGIRKGPPSVSMEEREKYRPPKPDRNAPVTVAPLKPHASIPPRRIPLLTLAEDRPKNLQIWELEAHHCKWPMGDPKDADFHCCGAVRKDDKSPYCAYHHERAYRPPGVRDRDPNWVRPKLHPRMAGMGR